MKKIFLFMIFALMIFFVSCKKSDVVSNEKTNNVDIVNVTDNKIEYTLSYYINDELYKEEKHLDGEEVELIDIKNEYPDFSGWKVKGMTLDIMQITVNTNIELYYQTNNDFKCEILNADYISRHMFNVGDEFDVLPDATLPDGYSAVAEIYNEIEGSLELVNETKVRVSKDGKASISLKIFNDDKLVYETKKISIIFPSSSLTLFINNKYHIIEGDDYFNTFPVFENDVVTFHSLEELEDGCTFIIKVATGAGDYEYIDSNTVKFKDFGEYLIYAVFFDANGMIIGATDAYIIYINDINLSNFDNINGNFLMLNVKNNVSYYVLKNRMVGIGFKNNDIIDSKLMKIENGEIKENKELEIISINYEIIRNGNNDNISIDSNGRIIKP